MNMLTAFLFGSAMKYAQEVLECFCGSKCQERESSADRCLRRVQCWSKIARSSHLTIKFAKSLRSMYTKLPRKLLASQVLYVQSRGRHAADCDFQDGDGWRKFQIVHWRPPLCSYLLLDSRSWWWIYMDSMNSFLQVDESLNALSMVDSLSFRCQLLCYCALLSRQLSCHRYCQ